MMYEDAVLGSTATKSLRTRNETPILYIGKDSFTRAQLAHVECFSFVAAANLSRIVNEQLRVKDTRALYHTIAPEALVLPGLGAIALSVLSAAFEAKGLGGATPLQSWVKKHRETVVTFGSMKVSSKYKDAAAAKAERAARRKRHTDPIVTPESLETSV